MKLPPSIEILSGQVEDIETDGNQITFSVGSRFVTLQVSSALQKSIGERRPIELAARRTLFKSDIYTGLAFRTEPRGRIVTASLSTRVFMPALAVLVLVVLLYAGLPETAKGITPVAGLMVLAALDAFRLTEIRRAVSMLESKRSESASR